MVLAASDRVDSKLRYRNSVVPDGSEYFLKAPQGWRVTHSANESFLELSLQSCQPQELCFGIGSIMTAGFKFVSEPN